MKKNDIQQLLDRFMNGTTTLDEERRLADYFRTAAVPDEWRAYKDMFAYFDAGMPAEATVADASENDAPREKPHTEKPRSTAIVRWWAVAAAIVLLAGTGIWMMRNAQPASQQQIAANASPATGTSYGVAPSDSLGEMGQENSTEHQISIEQSGGAKMVETSHDSTKTTPSVLPKHESMKYRYQPAPPKSYLAEADYENLGDSINQAVQLMAAERLRDIEQRQQTYFEAIQFVSALAVADVAAMADEEELY